MKHEEREQVIDSRLRKHRFFSFLRAVHRRLVIVRALEAGGIGIACGCAASLLLALCLWWSGRDALVLCIAAIAIGGITGLAWGWLCRPSAMDAAAEADRQLELADLLGSALCSLRYAGDPWHGAVVAVAEQRCAALSPSSVVLHRLGARAWGRI